MNPLSRRGVLAASAFAALAPRPAHAFYPDRGLRMIVPFPPGGAADFLGRTVGEQMTRGLGQPMVIENRTGAGGNIGTALAAQAERDGHTLLLNGVPIAVNRHLFAALPFDAERDFAPIAMLAVVPNIMVVPTELPANSVAEFVALARRRPATYASIGNGTSLHLAGAQFGIATGLDLTHVPYRETGAANTDLMAGRVDVMFQTISAAAGLVRGGRMKALAVTSAERVPAFADVPTLREAGVDLVSVGWFGLFAQRGVAADRLARLEAEALAATRDPVVAARIAESGSLPRAMPGADFGRFIAAETQRLAELVRVAGIRAD
ncbi:Bug family tripartite tricarboxylate transporter substrate binding protein [Plastoroseomonas hellenica]|uniref:Bug family tripartite tricarboxylate transporter substrate binding protein n=1 Tax=Plastoroseomonas hellenica TaxID=2687306 RepID=UPI001BA69596|nr:tripartite tricarboxylate transporter substrate-binding protein [Plastoroseomonas hellenica]MBR0647829.1 tripartite tricarboxylate transporter substrate binding protein [Plastoroseomonas hellenica]